VTLHQALKWSVNAGAIDRARVLRGWTRRDLAQYAHVDEGTLCDLFAGRRRPTFGTLHAICQALELSLEDVIVFSAIAIGARQDRYEQAILSPTGLSQNLRDSCRRSARPGDSGRVRGLET
jgi:DNA-binding Xre family transcriptional regulator